jgi:hypothetical protein
MERRAVEGAWSLKVCVGPPRRVNAPEFMRWVELMETILYHEQYHRLGLHIDIREHILLNQSQYCQMKESLIHHHTFIPKPAP